MTRLDCVIGSASAMRGHGPQAAHHARHRTAFGTPLVDQPLMRNVLADLALESEAATTLALRLAGAADRAVRGDEREAAFRRIALAVGEVLGLQARPGARRRGPGVPRRQRLRRGVRHAAALPRGAAELDLGGLGQRQRPRRAARAGPRAGRRSSAFFAEVELAAGADARLDAAAGAAARRSSPTATSSSARPPARRADGAGAAGLAAGAARAAAPSPTPSAPPGWAATGAAPSAPCRRARPRRHPGPGHACVRRPNDPNVTFPQAPALSLVGRRSHHRRDPGHLQIGVSAGAASARGVSVARGPGSVGPRRVPAGARASRAAAS